MHESNCVGFVYYELGITPEEKYHDCPKLYELLEKFDCVKKISAADAVAVVAPSNDGSKVVHMAIVNHGKGSIRHRKGVGQPVTESSLFWDGLKSYLRDYTNSELVYLAVKH